jgi:hypothetical protein
MDTQRMIEISILLADELLKKLEVEQWVYFKQSIR